MIKPTPGELAGMRSVLDEFANCTLTAVSVPGSPDEWDTPGDLEPIWTGAALAYIGREFKTAFGHGQNRSITLEQLEAGTTADTLTILDGRATLDIKAAVATQASVVTIEDRRTTPAVTLNFRASGTRHEMFGLLDYLIVNLADPTSSS